ncbi:ComF family protein [Lederbergia lenta]|nr:ComF family protein [Lederbergia lenta]MEC2322910.1 ComF family protein [Lederbergia lenta]
MMNNHCIYCDMQIVTEVTWRKLIFKSEEAVLCHHCFEKLTLIKGKRCGKCSRSLEKLKAEFITDSVCTDCVRWEVNPNWKDILQQNLSVFEYNEYLKEMLARYKYRGDYELAAAFSKEISACINQLTYDILVPIPLSEERLQERGFNQTIGLAEKAGFAIEDLLIRKHAEKQSKKTRQARMQSTDVFAVSTKEDLTEKHILLIDDIYTTGSTIRHAAKVLKQAGAKSISAFTLARG